jgi:hypothetical protein
MATFHEKIVKFRATRLCAATSGSSAFQPDIAGSRCDYLLKSRFPALDRAAEAYDIDGEARWLIRGRGVFA